MFENLIKKSNGSIKVSPEIVCEKAETIKHICVDIENCLINISDSVSKSKYFWESNSAQKVRELYYEQNGDIEECMEKLHGQIERLELISTVYRNTEQAARSEANELPSSILS